MEKLQRLTNLTKDQLDRIESEIGDAFAQEDGGMAAVLGDRLLSAYIKICVEIYYLSGKLYTFDHTGYVCYFEKEHPIKLKYHFMMAGMMFKRLGFKNVNKVMKALKGWLGYQRIYKDQNYLVLELIAIPTKYQGQKRMKPLMNAVFDEAKRSNIPCVLDTDTALKMNKYVSCGMRLKKETTIASGITVYVLEKSFDA